MTPVSPQSQFIQRLTKLPWWLFVILLALVAVAFQISTNAQYLEIFTYVARGLGVTIFVTLIAYLFAIMLGLIAGLGRVSKNPIIFNLATLYVQFIRGVPILVLIFFVVFVVAPPVMALIPFLNIADLPIQIPSPFGGYWIDFEITNFNFLVRVIFALAIAYGGFEAETFRAGIESIGKGQMEAARSLGMSYVQAMRYVILPQAIRRILPPLGNDFISMLKDSSLVSVMGVGDITQQARLYVAKTFVYPPTLTVLAFMYLSMTMALSFLVRWIENRMGKSGH